MTSTAEALGFLSTFMYPDSGLPPDPRLIFIADTDRLGCPVSKAIGIVSRLGKYSFTKLLSRFHVSCFKRRMMHPRASSGLISLMQARSPLVHVPLLQPMHSR